MNRSFFPSMLFVAWQGIYDPCQTQQKWMGTQGLSFYLPNLLCCLDQILGVMELTSTFFRHPKLSDPLILEVPDVWGMFK